jgi:hypothetical protein
VIQEINGLRMVALEVGAAARESRRPSRPARPPNRATVCLDTLAREVEGCLEGAGPALATGCHVAELEAADDVVQVEPEAVYPAPERVERRQPLAPLVAPPSTRRSRSARRRRSSGVTAGTLSSLGCPARRERVSATTSYPSPLHLRTADWVSCRGWPRARNAPCHRPGASRPG